MCSVEDKWGVFTKLEPCPCGSSVIIRKQEHYGDEWVVICPSCKSMTSFADGDSSEKTAELWNNRKMSKT